MLLCSGQQFHLEVVGYLACLSQFEEGDRPRKLWQPALESPGGFGASEQRGEGAAISPHSLGPNSVLSPASEELDP